MAQPHRSEPHPERQARAPGRGRRLGVAAGALLGLGVAWTLAPGVDSVVAAVEWVRAAGPLGMVAYAGLFVVASLLMMPGSWVQGAAGFLYGAAVGIPLASLLTVFSGLISYGLARTWLRGTLQRRLAHDARFRAIDNAIESGGAQLVMLLRIAPVSPVNVVHYLLGLTRVRARDFLLGTWVGTLPPVVLYVYIGSTVGNLTELLDGSATAGAWQLQVAGLVLTLVATFAVTRLARRALREALEQG